MNTPADINSQLAQLLPEGVSHCFSSALPDGFELYAAERHGLEKMVDKRRHEFSLGRHCAHQAIAQLGIEPSAITRGKQRQPLWPKGIIGSISHAGPVAAAIASLASDYAGLGLDIESAEALKPDLIPMVCRPEEQHLDGHRAKTLFSCKESIYKCLFPLLKVFIDFQEMQVVLDESELAFTAISHSPHCKQQLAGKIQGRYRLSGDYLLSCAWIKQ